MLLVSNVAKSTLPSFMARTTASSNEQIETALFHGDVIFCASPKFLCIFCAVFVHSAAGKSNFYKNTGLHFHILWVDCLIHLEILSFSNVCFEMFSEIFATRSHKIKWVRQKSWAQIGRDKTIKREKTSIADKNVRGAKCSFASIQDG